MDDTTLIAAAKKDLTWLQKHERIVLAVLILTVVLWCGNKYLNISAQNADKKAAISAQQLLDAKTAAEKEAIDAKLAEQQYQQIVDTLTRQNAALASAVTARNNATQQQQVTDRTMPLPDVANRWNSLAGLQDGDIVATSSGMMVTDSGARETVVQLEEIPTLKADLQDETTIAGNTQKELDKANSAIGALNTQVTGLNTELSAANKKYGDQINDIKANDHKKERNWFVRGLVVGGSVAAYVVIHYVR